MKELPDLNERRVEESVFSIATEKIDKKCQNLCWYTFSKSTFYNEILCGVLFQKQGHNTVLQTGGQLLSFPLVSFTLMHAYNVM